MPRCFQTRTRRPNSARRSPGRGRASEPGRRWTAARRAKRAQRFAARLQSLDRLLILCTGNATRSVIAGAVLRNHLPDVEVETAGTLSIDGLPMSWRTRAGFEHVGLPVPRHRSRQARGHDMEWATLVIGLAPEHVEWVRREHPGAAARTATLRRLHRELADDGRPLAERVAELHLADVALAPWEEIVDPGGGEVEAFTACAREVVDLVDELVDRLRPRPTGRPTGASTGSV